MIIKTLKTKKINNQTHDLKYGSTQAACFDLVSNEDVKWEIVSSEGIEETSETSETKEFPWTLLCYEAIVSTGYCFEIPRDFKMNIYPRSGWGFKHNIQLANGTGIIDADYRGEVKVKLIAFSNYNNLPQIKKGDRIAQAEISPVQRAEFEYVDSLDETTRGQSGFGSTGI